MTQFSSTQKAKQIWESKAKQVYKEGVKLFKEGVHGLEVMAEKTVEVGRIKLANQKAVATLKTLFADLGQRVYSSLLKQKDGVLKITPDISGFVEQIKKIQGFVENNIHKLRFLTTVAQSQSKKKKAPSKKTQRKKPSRSAKKKTTRKK